MDKKDEIVDAEVVFGDDSEKRTKHNCEKCDFIGKTEGGLKTHIITKHKTVSLRIQENNLIKEKEI